MAEFRGSKNIEANTPIGGNSDYFSLSEPTKKEKFTETDIRFLAETEDDIIGCTVHEVKVAGDKGDRRIDVNCIGKENGCPFCKSGRKPVMRVFMQVDDLGDDGGIKVWKRTGKFYNMDILPMLAKVKGDEIVGGIFNIKRYGGGLDTVYKVDFLEEDKTTIAKNYSDVEPLEVLGRFVYDKTIAEMEHWLATEVEDVGEFPATAEKQQGKRRTSAGRAVSGRAEAASEAAKEDENEQGSGSEDAGGNRRRDVREEAKPVGKRRRFE